MVFCELECKKMYFFCIVMSAKENTKNMCLFRMCQFENCTLKVYLL